MTTERDSTTGKTPDNAALNHLTAEVNKESVIEVIHLWSQVIGIPERPILGQTERSTRIVKDSISYVITIGIDPVTGQEGNLILRGIDAKNIYRKISGSLAPHSKPAVYSFSGLDGSRATGDDAIDSAQTLLEQITTSKPQG